MSNADGIDEQEGEFDEEDAGLLRTADSAGPVTMEIYVKAKNGLYRTLYATAQPRVTFDQCEGHFIAHGACIDCTQKTGKTVWAE